MSTRGGGPASDTPTAEELVARAVALRPRLLELQAETEARAVYSPEIHESFREAGFYRLFLPRRYGGLEVDLPAFSRIITEVARGCPSSAWCLCLGSGHTLQVASWFGQEAQDELFREPHFVAAAVAAPVGVAHPRDGGWALEGTHRYCSGAPYSTHYLGQTFAAGPDPDGPPGPMMLFIAPRSEWSMLDDWGDTLGLKGSGSHSLTFHDDAWVPSRFVLENTMMIDVNVDGGTVGSRLHGNHLYAGRALGFFALEMGAMVVGMAQGGLDELETALRTRRTQRPPIVLRYLDPDYQRWFGTALGRVEAAAAMQLQTAEEWMEVCRRSVEDGIPFSRREDLRLNIMAREVLRLSWDTMQELIFKIGGSSLARNGERMERIWRDMSMTWSHFHSILGDWAARELGREYFGVAG